MTYFEEMQKVMNFATITKKGRVILFYYSEEKKCRVWRYSDELEEHIGDYNDDENL